MIHRYKEGIIFHFKLQNLSYGGNGGIKKSKYFKW